MMGVSTQDLMVYRDRSLSAEKVAEYPLAEGRHVWQLERRAGIDRYPWPVRQFLKFLFWWKGIDPPGHHHDMGKYSSPERAEAAADFLRDDPKCKGDLWVIYPATVDETFPLERVRPQGLYSPRRRAVSNYVVISKRERELEAEQLRELVRILGQKDV